MKKKQDKNIEFVNFEADVKTKIVQEKALLSTKTKMSSKLKNKTKAKAIVEAKQSKVVKTKESKVMKLQKPVTKAKIQKKHNPIKVFFTSKEISDVLSGKQKCNVVLITDTTSKLIHKKALYAIIKANESNRKLNLQAS